MIIKTFEFNKINIDKYNLYLFYGENDGYKNEIIKNKFEKIYKNKIYRYEEKEVLEKKNDFFNTILSKSFFEDKKLIIIYDLKFYFGHLLIVKHNLYLKLLLEFYQLLKSKLILISWDLHKSNYILLNFLRHPHFFFA